MKRFSRRQLINMAAVAIVILANIAAQFGLLNGVTTGAVSDRFNTLFTPAGFVFSVIWTVIYIGLIAFAAYQALPSQRENPRLNRLGYLVAWTSVANILWLILWHYGFIPFTIIPMGALLILLIVIYLRLDTGHSIPPAQEHWFVRVPFSLYLGWITVATIANIAAILVFLNWDGFGLAPEAWTMALMVVAAALGGAAALTRNDVAYELVIIWALIGIAVRNSALSAVSTAAWGLALVVVVIGIIGYLRHRTLTLPTVDES